MLKKYLIFFLIFLYSLNVYGAKKIRISGLIYSKDFILSFNSIDNKGIIHDLYIDYYPFNILFAEKAIFLKNKKDVILKAYKICSIQNDNQTKINGPHATIEDNLFRDEVNILLTYNGYKNNPCYYLSGKLKIINNKVIISNTKIGNVKLLYSDKGIFDTIPKLYFKYDSLLKLIIK